MNAEQNANVAPVRPGVVTWFKVYCWMLCIVFFAVMLACTIRLIIGTPTKFNFPSHTAVIVWGINILMSAIVFIAALLPLIFRPRPWLWVYDLVVICIGLTSCCFWPICIPLLIYWIKPETKEYFGK